MCYERRDPNVARACWEKDQRGKKVAEYIEREALLEDIENTLVFSGRSDHQNQKQMGARMVVQRIRCAPAADVAPVVHGRWILKKNYHHGHYIDTDCFCSECNTLGSPQWKGCPVCLARMDGE